MDILTYIYEFANIYRILYIYCFLYENIKYLIKTIMSNKPIILMLSKDYMIINNLYIQTF